MPDTQQATGLEQELKQAFDGLHDSLQRASEATAALSALAPRVRAINDVFDQIEAAVHEGRRQIAGASAAIGGTQVHPATVTRPTLVVPAAGGRPALERPQTPIEAAPPPDAAGASTALHDAIGQPEDLVSFRLEFESRPAPLDLRAVDDAISEHPAVRDIALLDYDGHKATLKVWIEGGATPAAIQAAIREQVRTLFSPDNDVTVVALEDAA
ncbi:MAG: hypothetical protein ACYDEB_10305 [Dehalococcoidia bacterium]